MIEALYAVLSWALQLFIYFYFRGIHKFQLFTIVCLSLAFTHFSFASLPSTWGRIAIAAWHAALDPV